MPLFLEPNQRFPIVLDCDADKPAESRPTFFAMSLPMREQTRLSADVDKIFEDADTTDQICDRTVELLNGKLTGWANMGTFEFGKSDLREFLTQQEAMQLLRKILANNHLQPEEKKS